MDTGTVQPPDIERRTLIRIGWRLLPLMAICYFLNYLDRTNISVASLQMNGDLHISSTAYGFASGIFFLGYLLFEVPSNMILHRVGARVWIARILVTWGIVASAMIFAQGATSLAILRFILGFTEAGFFPGMILYLTYWFPAAQRGRMVGWFMAAVPISSALGSPLGGWLLDRDGGLGLHGWQWLFLVEGVPSILVGIVVFFLLTDRPEVAGWLPEDERQWLVGKLAAENEQLSATYHFSIRKALTNPRMLALSLIYFGIVFGLYGLGFWLPQIIKTNLHITSDLRVGLLVGLAYAVGAIAMVLASLHSDRTGERVQHVAIPSLMGGVALIVGAFLTGAPWAGYATLILGIAGVCVALPIFWSLPTAFLTGMAAAGGIALVNALGNLSGFVGPYWVGWVKDWTGDTKWGVVSIGVFMLIATVTTWLVGATPEPDDA